jgi:hypothetical protein
VTVQTNESRPYDTPPTGRHADLLAELRLTASDSNGQLQVVLLQAADAIADLVIEGDEWNRANATISSELEATTLTARINYGLYRSADEALVQMIEANREAADARKRFPTATRDGFLAAVVAERNELRRKAGL